MAARWLLSGRLRCALVTAVVLGLAVAGCGGANADGSELPPPFTPRPTTPAPPSPTSTLDPLEAEVLATVEGWLQGYVAALTGPDPTVGGMEAYATSGEISSIASLVGYNIRENIGFEGSVDIVWSRVDDDGVVLNEENDRGQAVVEACLDGTGFQRIDLETGESVPTGDGTLPQRNWVWVQVWHVPDTGWRVEYIPYIPGWFIAENDGHVFDERHQC